MFWVVLLLFLAAVSLQTGIKSSVSRSKGFLCLLHYEVLYEVADEETSSGLWLKLEKLYMTKSICNKLLLKRRLFGLHMKEGTPLKDHLDELNSILMELRDIDVKIEDEDAAMILLASLPPSYESFVNSLSVGNDCITMEEVKSSLHSRELRCKASGNTEETSGSGLGIGRKIVPRIRERNHPQQ
ncbi:gag-polypeptide of LTR copia-type [Sesbania bispinosa]|nr:gag-polypeptide of LTR copia-type [Sesbania bispinosa]